VIAAGPSETPLLYAHRGATAERPENTLPSFARALELGADALELDVHLTRDGHVVVSHDPSARRMCGVDAEIRRASLDDVKGWDAGHGFLDDRGGRPFAGADVRVPTLEQVLVEFPGVPLNVDVQQWSPPMVAEVLSVIRKQRAEDRVLLASFQLRTLRAIRQRYTGLTALSRPEVAALALAPAALLRRLPRAGDAAQVPPRVGPVVMASRGFIAKCHALGLRVDFWTIDDPAEAERLLDLGADGLMTDDPAAIAPVLARRRRRAAEPPVPVSPR
jgi:glycerophosphoryl diester phosphodiesterase